MKTLEQIDHTRGLCGTPDVPKNTPKYEVEKNPAHCICCSSEMQIVEPESVSLQQLGVYLLMCPTCPKTAE